MRCAADALGRGFLTSRHVQIKIYQTQKDFASTRLLWLQDAQKSRSVKLSYRRGIEVGYSSDWWGQAVGLHSSADSKRSSAGKSSIKGFTSWGSRGKSVEQPTSGLLDWHFWHSSRTFARKMQRSLSGLLCSLRRTLKHSCLKLRLRGPKALRFVD